MKTPAFLISLLVISLTLVPLSYRSNGTGSFGYQVADWHELESDLLYIWEFLRQNETKPVVVTQNWKLHGWFKEGYFNPFTAFSGHYPLLSDEKRVERYGIFLDDIQEIKSDRAKLFSGVGRMEASQILRRYDISYLILEHTEEPIDYTGLIKNLEFVLQSGQYLLYKVNI